MPRVNRAAEEASKREEQERADQEAVERMVEREAQQERSRGLNSDGIQAERHARQRQEADLRDPQKEHERQMRDSSRRDGPSDEKKEDRTLRVRTLNDRSVFNGHVLKKGSVVELKESDVINHRRHGVPLEDVGETEKDVEVIDVSQPFVAEGNGKEDDDE